MAHGIYRGMDTGDVPARARWQEVLASVDTPGAVAQLIVELALAAPGCLSATVSWSQDGDERRRTLPPMESPDHAGEALAELASATGKAARSEDRTRLAYPLSATGSAVLLLETDGPVADGTWAARDPLLQVAARQLGMALESERLRHAVAGLERSERVQRALFAISDLAGSDLDMPDVMKGIHAIVGTLMYAENFFIVLHDDVRDSMRFLYFADVEDPRPHDPAIHIAMADREHSLTWYLLRDGRPLMGNAEQLSRQVSGPIKLIGTDSFDWLGVPMLRDGRARGAIVVQCYHEDIVFSADDRALLEFVGSHILIALERKQGKEDLEGRVRERTLELADSNRVLQGEIVERQRAERLQSALFHIAQLATSDIGHDQFFPRVHAEIGALINATNFFIGMLSEDGGSLQFPYYVDAEARSQPTRPLGRGLSEYVIRHGRALFGMTEDIFELARRGEIDTRGAGSPAVCWLGVPLVVDERPIGLIAVQSYDPAVVYSAADQELLGFVASQIANTLRRRRAADALHEAYAELEKRVQERTRELRQQIAERERIQAQLEHEVMHDAMTGLPNRGYLLDRLTRVLGILKREPKRRCALLYLDVDRFKVINDSLGHLAGDEVLREVSRRLLTCVREPDLVARLSGDEFAILLEDVVVPSTAIKVAQRALAAMAVPAHVAGRELELSASIGIAIGDMSYGHADEVLRDADTALYRAKQLGRKRFELFDESLQTDAVNVLAVEGELRLALLHEQIEPHFQPIIDLASGAVVGYEALIRWNHPTRGLLGPAQFLKIAEDSGSIEALDWRMFELSCGLAAQWGPAGPYLTINVSPLHFRRPGFDSRLIALLLSCGMPPDRLLIEITEGSLLDDPVGVSGMLERLRAAGIGAALDDFGTGYSSLSYLHRFPFRILKIDRSFVSDLGKGGANSSSTVVAAVLALARALGMGVIAEGIETAAQHADLIAMGCTLGQGFLLGRPAPGGPGKAMGRNSTAS